MSPTLNAAETESLFDLDLKVVPAEARIDGGNRMASMTTVSKAPYHAG